MRWPRFELHASLPGIYERAIRSLRVMRQVAETRADVGPKMRILPDLRHPQCPLKVLLS